MPTALPSGEKSAFIAIVNTQDPGEAIRLASLLNNYEDIAPIGIGRQGYVFASNNNYLKEAIAVFTDANLVAVGIYNGKTSSSPLSNPVMIINSSYTGGITISATQYGFGIFGQSYVNNVTISSSVNLTNLVIGPGSTVDIINSSADNSFINNISVFYYPNNPAFLNSILYGSKYGNVTVVPGSYYGGITNTDPEATCTAGPVTGLYATDITHNSIALMWTPPASGFIGINTFYKKTDSQIWIPATQNDGDFIQSSGFIFRSLEADTYYDFKVAVICNNGGIANAFVSAQTVCCGSNTGLRTSACLITVLIKATPDPSKLITLCNGVIIAQEYPEGATLTIPYLIGKKMASDVVVSNVVYQQMPFNSTTGVFTASSTPLTLFQEPNVVSVGFDL